MNSQPSTPVLEELNFESIVTSSPGEFQIGAHVFIRHTNRHATVAGMSSQTVEVSYINPKTGREEREFYEHRFVELDRRADAKGEDAERTLRPFNLRELLRRPDPKWIVKDIIPEKALVVLYGEPNCGKTFLAIHLAAAMALDKEFLGIPVLPGAVLYISGEGSGGLRKRFEAAAAGVVDAEYSSADNKLWFIDEPVSFLSDDAIANLNDTIEKLPEAPKLIVVDTLAHAAAGGDENAVKDVQLVINNAHALQRRWGSTVLFIHHSVKSSPDVERGSTALRGSCDAMLCVKQEDSNKRSLAVSKQRDVEILSPIPFELEQVELAPAPDGTTRTSCVVKPLSLATSNRRWIGASDAQTLVQHILKHSPKNGFTITELMNACDLKRSRVYTLIAHCVDDGYVTEVDCGNFKRYPPTGKEPQLIVSGV